MVKEIQPKDTTRTVAYELWMKAPNPMVTFLQKGISSFGVFTHLTDPGLPFIHGTWKVVKQEERRTDS